MDILNYLKLSNEPVQEPTHLTKAAIITNFTDDLFKKILKGMCAAERIECEIYGVPYGQYQFELKNPESALYTFQAQMTFVFFDANPFIHSDFTADLEHASRTLEDIKAYCALNKGTVIAQTMIVPSHTVHGNLFRENALHSMIENFNSKLTSLSDEIPNLYVLDTNRLTRYLGEKNSRDLRSQYAFRQPFTHDFIGIVTKEWFSYIRASLGKTRKCIVVDLDNTLWGGVVGETGPLGIALGADYPGNAFQSFQRVLLDYYHRGIILAINSRNNPDDVKEVFEKNNNMILNEKHFSAIYTNWKTKAENLQAIAQDLNIGLDSLVFIDDDPMNRDMVRTQLPQVHVPDFSLPPEEYSQAVLQLNVFHQLKITDEDRARGQMYAEERQRKDVQTTSQSLEDYISQLGIEIDLYLNPAEHVPRLSQLTLKTNQFNLTTKRYSENEIKNFMDNSLVICGDIRDRFGSYGITLEVIITTQGDEASLDTLLMSCRVMGRGVEKEFFNAMALILKQKGIKTLSASFIPTQKNMPAADFLPNMGLAEVERSPDGTVHYSLDLDTFAPSFSNTIKINYLTNL